MDEGERKGGRTRETGRRRAKGRKRDGKRMLKKIGEKLK
jgi:hypothetical protein